MLHLNRRRDCHEEPQTHSLLAHVEGQKMLDLNRISNWFNARTKFRNIFRYCWKSQISRMSLNG
jgi:hypothetical protein